jgi:tetratricopeptide (TPR) repeat protein
VSELDRAAGEAFVASRFDDAIDLWSVALAEVERTPCARREELLLSLAEAHSARGDKLKATLLRSEVLGGAGPNSVDRDLVLLRQQKQASDLDSIGQYEEAEAVWKAILQQREKHGPALAYGDALAMYAQHLMARQRIQDALVYLDRAIAVHVRDGRPITYIRAQRAAALVAGGNAALGAKEYRALVAEGHGSGVSNSTISIWNEALGDLAYRQAQLDEAVGAYSGALNGMTEEDLGGRARLLHKMLRVRREQKREDEVRSLTRALQSLLAEHQLTPSAGSPPIEVPER